ncbi:hypothetical protein BD779DRAFT_1680804 [Infundibulicybe gibba]|nr:hypothetical protein BD779DRAFT_1680804 [Infundibulicybe gibba]
MTTTSADMLTLSTILEAMFYGAYVVLFILYLILRRRNHRAVDRPLTLAQILLFGLCTLSVCLDIPGAYFLVLPDVENDVVAYKIATGSMVIFGLIDYLAQMILLYRCWIIWSRRWVVVAVPGFLALVTLGGGFGLIGFQYSPLWNTDLAKSIRLYRIIGTMTYSTSLAVNALTTSLIVTKIFLTSREVHAVLGFDSHHSFRIVVAMLIESGLLMFAFQLVLTVLFAARLAAVDIIYGPITHIYGITPVLLYIRVVMGTTYDETTEKTGSLKFAHSRGAATLEPSATSASAAGAQSRAVDVELGSISDNEGATDTPV